MTPLEEGLAGRVALVTGAASGIGLAIARRLAVAGTRVILADIDGAGAQDAARQLRGDGLEAVGATADVTRADSMQALADLAVSTYGALHLAVNNAGISGTQAPLADQSVADWLRVIDHNLNGVFFGMRSQIPAILAAGGGSIVNIASVMGQVGSARSPAYTAAKHAVVGMTRSAALAYAARGVRINAIGPGYIRTPLLRVLDETALARATNATPAGRLGEPEEIAELAAFLLSQRSSFTTGALYLADGGFTAA